MQRVRKHNDVGAGIGKRQVLTNALEIGPGMIRVGFVGGTQHDLATLHTNDVGSLAAQPPHQGPRTAAHIYDPPARDLDKIGENVLVGTEVRGSRAHAPCSSRRQLRSAVFAPDHSPRHRSKS